MSCNFKIASVIGCAFKVETVGPDGCITVEANVKCLGDAAAGNISGSAWRDNSELRTSVAFSAASLGKSDICVEPDDEEYVPPFEIENPPLYAEGIHSSGTDVYLAKSSYDYSTGDYIGIIWRYGQDMTYDDKLYFTLDQQGTFPTWTTTTVNLSAKNNKDPFQPIYAGSCFDATDLKGTWVDPVTLYTDAPSPEYISVGGRYIDREDGAERVPSTSTPNQYDTITGWYVPSDSPSYAGSARFLAGGAQYSVYGGPIEDRFFGTFRGYWHKRDEAWYWDMDTYTLFDEVDAKYPPQETDFDFTDKYVEAVMQIVFMSNSDMDTCQLGIGMIENEPIDNGSRNRAVIVEGAIWDNTLSLKYEKDTRINDAGNTEYFMNARVMSGSYWIPENFATIENCTGLSPNRGKTWYWNDNFIVVYGMLDDDSGTTHYGWFVIDKPRIIGKGEQKLTWRDITEKVNSAISEVGAGSIRDATLHADRLLILAWNIGDGTTKVVDVVL